MSCRDRQESQVSQDRQDSPVIPALQEIQVKQEATASLDLMVLLASPENQDHQDLMESEVRILVNV